MGIVDNGRIRYIIACFTPVEESMADPKLKVLSKKVFELIEHRHGE